MRVSKAVTQAASDIQVQADGIQGHAVGVRDEIEIEEISQRERPEGLCTSTTSSKAQHNGMMSVEDLPIHHLLQRSKSCPSDFTANVISQLISRCEKEVDSENRLIFQAVISKFGAI